MKLFNGKDDELYLSRKQWKKVFLAATSNFYMNFRYRTGGPVVGDTITFERIQLFDLTLMFGAGKEPTSINDPRIQYIIEQGYIPTNTTGTNKSIASEVLPNIDFKMKCR